MCIDYHGNFYYPVYKNGVQIGAELYWFGDTFIRIHYDNSWSKLVECI